MAVAVSNPLYEVQRESRRTTINGVPASKLAGRLPPPDHCTRCGYPVWFLDDPDAIVAQPGADDGRAKVTMVGEVSMTCVDSGKQHLTAPLCGHPYHLVPHRPRCDPDNPQIFVPPPDGLIVRPPR